MSQKPPKAKAVWPDAPAPNQEAWQKAASKSAPNGNVDGLGWETPDGIHLKALYTQADLAGVLYTNSLPGFEPYL
ncbi:MAG: hypothetical protein RL162_944, partial [Pseudomonadota bacterium]